MKGLLIAGSIALLFAVAGCSTTSDEATPDSTSPTMQTIPSTASPAPSEPPTTVAADPDPGTSVTDGTIVRFTSGDFEVDVTIVGDNPSTRDFLSMLPLTLSFEEFAGREKISYLPRELDTDGSPGSDPEDGDLIYFVPWGNLGFYYNTAGIGYSDEVIHLGTYSASIEQLTQLEGDGVTVEIVE